MIHYHGIKLSGGLDTHLSLQGKHAFISYSATDNCYTEMAAELCQSFAIDNGAYSMWKTGKKYSVEGFVEYMLRWYRHPALDFYLLPDVIDGGEEANQKIRAEFYSYAQYHRGLMDLAVPVWHLDESLEELQYMTVAYKRIALGSAGDYAVVGNKKWWHRISEVMEVVCDDQGRPKCKLHGLRMLDNTITSHLPLSSADSTNVARNIGIDKAWDKAPYAPASNRTRALVMMERIERHASAARWNGTSFSKPNYELFG